VEVRVGARVKYPLTTSGTRRGISLLCACTLALVACSGGGSSGSGSTTTLGVTPTSGIAQPKTGGNITFATYAETNGLDPTVSFATGVIGGAELAALYDVLMRYDPTTGKYSPGTAQSLEPNADNSVWTLKLRPNIKFTDGTDYDAAAVKFNIERHAAPGSTSNFLSQVSNI